MAIASEVIHEAQRGPADAALRKVLKERGLSQWDRQEVTRAVFAFYRWQGWLDVSGDITGEVSRAFELQLAFDANPAKIPDEELIEKAIPKWVPDAFSIPAATVREFQREPRLWLRARKGEGGKLADLLRECEQHAVLSDALWYRGDHDLFLSEPFHEGACEIQDISSQAVGILCGAKPGETWWDACAGEGGKTLHLADMMGNRGLIWATDRAAWRLEKLKRRAARAKVFNYRTKHWPSLERLPVKARMDGLLVDAPCSGIGTWGRNPHARWTLTPQDLQELSDLQKTLLDKVAESVKPGGRLVYSVCTLAPAETVEVARHFESRHPEFQRVTLVNPIFQDRREETDLWIWPHEVRGNGMYVAAWSRS